jgi:hypothetical protein
VKPLQKMAILFVLLVAVGFVLANIPLIVGFIDEQMMKSAGRAFAYMDMAPMLAVSFKVAADQFVYSVPVLLGGLWLLYTAP